MKKTFLTAAILSVLLLSCKDSKTSDTEMVHDHETEAMHHDDHDSGDMVLDNSWIHEIQLDNGSKWDANIETTEGVNKMMSLIKNSEPKTVEDYHSLASKLNDEKNIVIKECTMVGPSHDNLHVFLHPLIDKIEALGKVTTLDKGAEMKSRIEEDLSAYYNYFK